MDNWEELDRFLEKFNIPRLNQKEEIMNNPITSIEMEAVVKNLQQNKTKQNKTTTKKNKTEAQDQMPSQENSIKHLEKR